MLGLLAHEYGRSNKNGPIKNNKVEYFIEFCWLALDSAYFSLAN